MVHQNKNKFLFVLSNHEQTLLKEYLASGNIVDYTINMLLIIIHNDSAEEPDKLQKTGNSGIFRKIKHCISTRD